MKCLKLCMYVLLFLGFTPTTESVKILCLGDSITQGGKVDRPEYTYRLPLQMILYNKKIPFDFIGSRQKGLQDSATWPDVAQNVPFDPDHEGYYGNKTADACRKAMEGYEMYKTPPDIILVHLGTNDQKNGPHETTVGKPLREMISFFRDKNPHVVILLGHLNFNGSKAAFEIRDVVEKVASELSTKTSPVQTVHHYNGWYENPNHIYTDTFDWAHPNLKGQEKMAVAWWKHIKEFLNH